MDNWVVVARPHSSSLRFLKHPRVCALTACLYIQRWLMEVWEHPFIKDSAQTQHPELRTMPVHNKEQEAGQVSAEKEIEITVWVRFEKPPNFSWAFPVSSTAGHEGRERSKVYGRINKQNGVTFNYFGVRMVIIWCTIIPTGTYCNVNHARSREISDRCA